MDFCTIADVEAFLQMTIPAAGLASANKAIDWATEAIRNYCHQVIERVTGEVIALDCKGGTIKLFLPELPVITVTSVVEDGELLVVTDDYKLGQHGILYRVNDEWPEGIQIIRITYTHGYAVIPDDVVGVCARAASRAYQAGLSAAAVAGVTGVTGLTLGDYSVQYGAASTVEGMTGASGARLLLLSEKDILNRYRYIAQ